MVRVIRFVAIVAVVVLGWALARPAPRLPSPLPLTSDVTRGTVVHDPAGKPVMRGVRAVEEGVFYTGSALPTGTSADETAFVFLRKNNVRLFVSLQTDERQYYDEEGYLQYWADQTGYQIATIWLPVPREHTYELSEQSALHAAAEVISRLKQQWPLQGAVYLQGDDASDAAAIVVAAYELWRNRGWQSPDSLWASVESRFMRAVESIGRPVEESRREALRVLRRRMEYLGEL